MKILMLGNGFDLYHNLLTNYEDFITIGQYLKENHYNLHCENTNVYSELKELSENNESIGERLAKYEEAYSKANINPNEYARFLQLLHSNCWFQYFSEIQERDGWVALESQIDEFLRKRRNNDSSEAKHFSQLLCKKGKCASTTSKHQQEQCFLDPENDDIIFKDFVEFVDLLRLYLKIFVNDVLSNISETHRFENTFLNNIDYIVSFNYTDTYKQLYHKSTNTVYIHGKLNNGKHSNSIIVGVNSDESDDVGIRDSRFIKYKKYYQRITKHTNEGLKGLIYFLNLRKGQERELIVIGHSLDSADEDIIRVIFDWFAKIKIYYHDDQALDKYVKNLKQIFGAKNLSEMTFSQKIVFEKLPENIIKPINKKVSQEPTLTS